MGYGSLGKNSVVNYPRMTFVDDLQAAELRVRTRADAGDGAAGALRRRQHGAGKPPADAVAVRAGSQKGLAGGVFLLAPRVDQALGMDFEPLGVEFVETVPAPAGDEALEAAIYNGAEIDIWGNLYRQKLVDIARGAADGDKDSYFAELNERWGASVEKLSN